MRQILKLSIAAALMLIALSWAVMGNTAHSEGSGEEFYEIAPQGFGDIYNNGAWSMQWWDGYLYVGTVRSFFCWSQASLSNQFPFLPYPPNDPEYDCPPDVHDIPLRAEIWRYSFTTAQWERVYQAPATVPEPGSPGEFIAREVGYRDMAVVTEPDGTEALYVGSVFPHVLSDPDEPPPPRLLRTTDGVNWEPLPQDPGTTLGEVDVPSFSRLTAYENRLFAVAGTIQGDGTILMSNDPAAGNDSYVPVSPVNTSVFEMEIYNGLMYAGTNTELNPEVAQLYLPIVVRDDGGSQGPPNNLPYDLKQVLDPPAARVGFSVLKADVSGDPPYNWVEVMVDGGDRENKPSKSVVSMEEYDGRLYIGTDTPAEVLRINPDDTWDVIVGTTRVYPDGTIKPPLSGLGDGFGWFLNVHVWRMQEHQDKLYVGTADEGTRLRNFNFIPTSWRDEFGFDLWVTEDGETFSQLTKDGFGDIYQMGVRTFSSTPTGIAMGSINFWDGLMIYFNPDDATGTPLASPKRLWGEDVADGTLLSWEPVDGATTYHLYRARFASNDVVGVENVAPDMYVPLSGFELVASTDDFYYIDEAVADTERYLYQVVAEDATGALSAASNVIQAPAVAPGVTLSQVEASLIAWQNPAVPSQTTEVGITAPLATIQSLVQAGDIAAARTALAQFGSSLEQAGLFPEWRLSDVTSLLDQLDRRLQLVEASVLPAGAIE